MRRCTLLYGVFMLLHVDVDCRMLLNLGSVLLCAVVLRCSLFHVVVYSLFV